MEIQLKDKKIKMLLIIYVLMINNNKWSYEKRKSREIFRDLSNIKNLDINHVRDPDPIKDRHKTAFIHNKIKNYNVFRNSLNPKNKKGVKVQIVKILLLNNSLEMTKRKSNFL